LFGKTPLKAQNDYIFQKFWGAWLRLCIYVPLISAGVVYRGPCCGRNWTIKNN